jgi:hypothetical protein
MHEGIFGKKIVTTQILKRSNLNHVLFLILIQLQVVLMYFPEGMFITIIVYLILSDLF